MPFRERSVEEDREAFCRLAMVEGANVRELCRRFGVSSSTGYLWLERWRSAGREGLSDRSRRPATSPKRTVAELEVQVLAVRAAHPVWGGRKIRRVLERQGVAAPSASTITEILRRHGKLDGPGAGEPRAWTRFEHAEPNDLWQMDFKGHFALEAGRCHPLTVLDDHSRYALELGACGDEQGQTVQARLTQVFRHYGLPRRILADNGPPWGTAGPERHTPLTVWLLDLGVPVSHGRPYHPQTQGKEERFHRTLKAEVLDGRCFQDLAQAQAAFDAWRGVYNHHRPHQALGQHVPARRYRVSPRRFPVRIAPPEYDTGEIVRTVHHGGWISFRGRRLYGSKAFASHRIALRPTDTDGRFNICYRSHVVGHIDLNTPL